MSGKPLCPSARHGKCVSAVLFLSFPAVLYINDNKICILDISPGIHGQHDSRKLLQTASINRHQVSLMLGVVGTEGKE